MMNIIQIKINFPAYERGFHGQRNMMEKGI